MRGNTFYIVISILIIPFIGFSQENSKNKNSSNAIGIGFDAGITTFSGDIDEGSAQGDIFNNMAYRVSLHKNLSKWFFLEGQVLFGNLSGEKKRGSGESLNYQYFKTEFIEYSLNADINIVPILSKNPNPKFNICFNIGAGIFTYKAKLYDGNDDSVLDSYGYDGEKSSPEFVIPVGIKLGYNISKHFYLLAQTSSRMVNSDLIDAKEGNNNSDFYNYTSVGFVYKIFLTPSSKNRYRDYGQYNKKSKRRNSRTACATFN